MYKRICIVAALCCTAYSAKAQSKINPTVLAWLDSTYYFFASYDDTTKSEPVWKNGAGKSDLVAIVNDTTLQLKPRFLAAEILFERDATFPNGTDLFLLGRLYSDALKEPVSAAAEWGRPFVRKDLGVIGPHLLRIGKPAVPAFASLLDNNEKIFYSGGDKDTEVPNSYRFRIKDFAAFYICKLNGWRYHCFKSPEKRDKKIARLKQRLNVP